MSNKVNFNEVLKVEKKFKNHKKNIKLYIFWKKKKNYNTYKNFQTNNHSFEEKVSSMTMQQNKNVFYFQKCIEIKNKIKFWYFEGTPTN